MRYIIIRIKGTNLALIKHSFIFLNQINPEITSGTYLCQKNYRSRPFRSKKSYR